MYNNYTVKHDVYSSFGFYSTGKRLYIYFIFLNLKAHFVVFCNIQIHFLQQQNFQDNNPPILQ